MLLTDKVIYITGGTSGIGAATVTQALQEGAKVFFVGTNQEEWESMLAVYQKDGYWSDTVGFAQVDVRDAKQQAAGIQACMNKWGRIDWVFANAGKHMVGNIVNTTLEQRQEMFRVDVEWVYLTLHYAIPYMQKHGWSIVLMGSDQSLIGKWDSSAYGAAKWAIGQLTKSTAIDFAQDAIRVNAVCPGTIDTPLARGAIRGFSDTYFAWNYDAWVDFLANAQPIKRLGEPEEVANLVCFLLSDKAGFMTGSLVSIDGWYTAQ